VKPVKSLNKEKKKFLLSQFKRQPSQYSPVRSIREYLEKQRKKDNVLKFEKEKVTQKQKLILLKGLPKNLRKEDKYYFEQFLIKPKVYFSEQKGFALLDEININFTSKIAVVLIIILKSPK
jgi:hypothetical protein